MLCTCHVSLGEFRTAVSGLHACMYVADGEQNIIDVRLLACQPETDARLVVPDQAERACWGAAEAFVVSPMVILHNIYRSKPIH